MTKLEMTLSNDMYMGNAGGVCSLWRLHNFGEGSAVFRAAASKAFNYEPCAKDFDEFKERLRQLCLHRTNLPIFSGSAVFAVVSDIQPKAFEYLTQLGFYKFRVPVYPKYSHGINYMIIDMHGFMSALGQDFLERQQKAQEDAEKEFPTPLAPLVFTLDEDNWEDNYIDEDEMIATFPEQE